MIPLLDPTALSPLSWTGSEPVAYFQMSLPFPSLHRLPSLVQGLLSKPSAPAGKRGGMGKEVAHLPLVDGNPVSCGKPLVVLDIVNPILEVPKAFGEVHLQQVPQQILQVRAEVGWEPHLERGLTRTGWGTCLESRNPRMLPLPPNSPTGWRTFKLNVL